MKPGDAGTWARMSRDDMIALIQKQIDKFPPGQCDIGSAYFEDAGTPKSLFGFILYDGDVPRAMVNEQHSIHQVLEYLFQGIDRSVCELAFAVQAQTDEGYDWASSLRFALQTLGEE